MPSLVSFAHLLIGMFTLLLSFKSLYISHTRGPSMLDTTPWWVSYRMSFHPLDRVLPRPNAVSFSDVTERLFLLWAVPLLARLELDAKPQTLRIFPPLFLEVWSLILLPGVLSRASKDSGRVGNGRYWGDQEWPSLVIGEGRSHVIYIIGVRQHSEVENKWFLKVSTPQFFFPFDLVQPLIALIQTYSPNPLNSPPQ